METSRLDRVLLSQNSGSKKDLLAAAVCAAIVAVMLLSWPAGQSQAQVENSAGPDAMDEYVQKYDPASGV